MAAPRVHLARAPIAEAIWDLRFHVPDEDSALRAITEVSAGLKAHYPNQTPISRIAGSIFGSASGAHGATSNATPYGVLLRSDHGTAAQLRTDGFTFSKLRPYVEWAQIVKETTQLWTALQAAMQPSALNRAALRYVNDMVFPHGDLATYLTAPPRLPPDIPQITREFLSRMVIWDQQHNASVIITQAMGQPATPDSMRVLLDIDAYFEGALAPDIAAVGPVMDSLHQIKNQVFFASLTEEAIRFYE